MKCLAKGAALLLLLTGCATGPLVTVRPTEGDLRGMVYDLDRQPVAEAVVALADQSPPVSVVTDLHGRFSLGTQPFGPLRLSVQKPGTEPLSWAFDFHPGSEVVYLQLATEDQLYDRASDALQRRHWQAFDENLARASALNPESLQGMVLAALALEARGRAQEAVDSLMAHPLPRPVLAVELLLGDLLSQLGQKAEARVHWLKALEIKEDQGLRARLAQD